MVLDIALLQSIVSAWGYLGVFLVNAISSATIILPLPGFVVTLAFATALNPWLLAVSAGLGSAVGELTGYAVGRGGREAIKEKYEKWFAHADRWVQRHGPFPIILLFAAAPLPTDIVGLLSGIIRYDVRKFFLAVAVGKIIRHLILIFAFLYGIQLIFSVGDL
jgi:membrane protein YqaA with SNARE-associated domain